MNFVKLIYILIISSVLLFKTGTIYAFPQYTENELFQMESDFNRHKDDKDNSGTIEKAYILCSSYTVSGNREKALKYADILIGMLNQENTVSDRLSIYAYSAQAYLAFDKYHKADSILNCAFSLWNEIEGSFLKGSLSTEANSNPTAIAILFNAAGVYSVNVEMNYEKATEYFLQGMNFAKLHLRSMDYAVLSNNLLMTYFIRNNPEGLVYAQDIYNDGKEKDDIYLLFMGAYESAMMYYISGDYKSAEKYILEAINSEVKINTVYVFNMYANILYKTGRSDEANEYYLKAMSGLPEESATIASYVCLSYGTYLFENGHTDKSIEILSKGLEIAMSKNNKVFTHKLNRILSEAYSKKGMYKKALNHYRLFHQESDSIFNLKRERTISQLMLKYRTALFESKVKEKDLQLIKQSRTIMAISAISVMVLVISVILWFLNRKTNSMYTKIVRQYQNAISDQKRLSEQLEQYKSAQDSQSYEKDVETQKTNTDDIADKLEYLMKQVRIYRDNTLSREKLAEMAGTNRTYLTKTIKDKFNKSVNQYINSYRINHAIEILSNEKSDVPLKSVEFESGFSSSSNFFKLFKEEVGMSPAKFREKVLELSSGQSNN